MSQQSEAVRAVRGVPRASKLQEAQEVFVCECGRQYLTFSALYLHAKLKHQLRLTSKRGEDNHLIELKDGRKITTYFLKQAHYNLTPQESLPASRSAFFRRILQNYRSSASSSPQLEPFLQLLGGYIEEIAEQLDSDSSLPGDLSLYFNEFSVHYLPVRGKKEGQGDVEAVRRYGEEIVRLWQWLKAEGLSQVELQLHDLYRLPHPAHK